MRQNGEVPLTEVVNVALNLHDDWVGCEDVNCCAVFEWDKLPDCYVRTEKEYHGEPHLRPEIIVVGWTCPKCGHDNSL
jgi:hypothetical protein